MIATVYTFSPQTDKQFKSPPTSTPPTSTPPTSSPLTSFDNKNAISTSENTSNTDTNSSGSLSYKKGKQKEEVIEEIVDVVGGRVSDLLSFTKIYVGETSVVPLSILQEMKEERKIAVCTCKIFTLFYCF